MNAGVGKSRVERTQRRVPGGLHAHHTHRPHRRCCRRRPDRRPRRPCPRREGPRALPHRSERAGRRPGVPGGHRHRQATRSTSAAPPTGRSTAAPLPGARRRRSCSGGQDGRTSAVGLKVVRRATCSSPAAPPAASSCTTWRRATWSGPSARPGHRRRRPSSTTRQSPRTAASTSPTRSVRSLYRIAPDDYATDGVETLPVFVDFTGTAAAVRPRQFNVNGIVATPDGGSLVLAQSNTRKLYRVALRDRRGHRDRPRRRLRQQATVWSFVAARCTPSNGRARWASS